MNLLIIPDMEDDLGSFAQAAAQERAREAEEQEMRRSEALLDELLRRRFGTFRPELPTCNP